MNQSDSQPSTAPPPTLAYAAGLPRVRTSRLAIASLVVSILCSPLLLGALSNWINWYVPRQFNQTGQYGFVHFWFIRCGIILATVLPVAAIVRICFSRHTRRGIDIAVLALLISFVWWGLLWLAHMMWSGFSRD